MYEVGNRYETNNYGSCVIIEKLTRSWYRVKFDTGYITKTRSDKLRLGTLKDPYYPIVHGVGFMGVGKWVSSVGKNKTKEYIKWSSMMDRCYGTASYRGGEVCKPWHNFQNFCESIQRIPGYNLFAAGYDVELDKDLNQHGTVLKVYSEATCQFLRRSANLALPRTVFRVTFKDPKGMLHVTDNIKQFARTNSLCTDRLSKLSWGQIKQHHGWTLKERISFRELAKLEQHQA